MRCEHGGPQKVRFVRGRSVHTFCTPMCFAAYQLEQLDYFVQLATPIHEEAPMDIVAHSVVTVSS